MVNHLNAQSRQFDQRAPVPSSATMIAEPVKSIFLFAFINTSIVYKINIVVEYKAKKSLKYKFNFLNCLLWDNRLKFVSSYMMKPAFQGRF